MGTPLDGGFIVGWNLDGWSARQTAVSNHEGGMELGRVNLGVFHGLVCGERLVCEGQRYKIEINQ